MMNEDEQTRTPEKNEPASARGCAAATATEVATADARPLAARPRRVHRPRKRRGIGIVPLYAIQKERLQEFNLVLDINNLKVEIQRLDQLRQLLQSKALVTRESREGSLMKCLATFYERFNRWSQQRERAGFLGKKTTSGEGINDDQQKSFLESIMHTQVDCGGGVIGVDAMWAQCLFYEDLIRPRVHKWWQTELLHVEEDLLIKIQGIWVATITHTTIEKIFPHLVDHERIVNKLVGREITFSCVWDFVFNGQDRVVRYGVAADFASGFANVLKDPNDVAIVLGDARIVETASTLQVDVELEEEKCEQEDNEEQDQVAEIEEYLPRVEQSSDAQRRLRLPDGRLLTHEKDGDGNE